MNRMSHCLYEVAILIGFGATAIRTLCSCRRPERLIIRANRCAPNTCATHDETQVDLTVSVPVADQPPQAITIVCEWCKQE